MSKVTICSIDGCDRIHQARGWCQPHYKRWKKYGDPLGGRTYARWGVHLAWLTEAVNCDTDECIIWPYGTAKGYGMVNRSRFGSSRAHAATLILSGSPRPPAPINHALHSCPGGANRACCNLRHLRWGTNKDNIDDLLAETGRHGNAVLTPDQVRVIRTSPLTATSLGIEYGVNRHTIADVRNGKTWKHLL